MLDINQMEIFNFFSEFSDEFKLISVIWLFSIFSGFILRGIINKLQYKNQNSFIKMILLILLSPGVVFHEFSHKFACMITRVSTERIKLFDFDSGMGFVKPKNVERRGPLTGFYIVFTPLIFSSLTILFLMEVSLEFEIDITLKIIIFWLILSILINAGPSSRDLSVFKSTFRNKTRNLLDFIIIIISFPLYLYFRQKYSYLVGTAFYNHTLIILLCQVSILICVNLISTLFGNIVGKNYIKKSKKAEYLSILNQNTTTTSASVSSASNSYSKPNFGLNVFDKTQKMHELPDNDIYTDKESIIEEMEVITEEKKDSVHKKMNIIDFVKNEIIQRNNSTCNLNELENNYFKQVEFYQERAYKFNITENDYESNLNLNIATLFLNEYIFFRYLSLGTRNWRNILKKYGGDDDFVNDPVINRFFMRNNSDISDKVKFWMRLNNEYREICIKIILDSSSRSKKNKMKIVKAIRNVIILSSISILFFSSLIILDNLMAYNILDLLSCYSIIGLTILYYLLKNNVLKKNFYEKN